LLNSSPSSVDSTSDECDEIRAGSCFVVVSPPRAFVLSVAIPQSDQYAEETPSLRQRTELNGGQWSQRMPRLREILVVSAAYAACLLVYSSSIQAQPAPPAPLPGKVVGIEPSPLLVEPKTPEESFAAALLMVDLARVDLARKYLEQFEASAPDDAMLMAMRDKHGTGEFLKLARIKDLQPLSSDLLDRLNAASRKQSEDPAFVDALLARLSQGSAQRELAITELRNAGPRAVPQVIRQMSQPNMEGQQDQLVYALIRMGRQIVPPLLGALDTPQERVRAAIIGILATLEAKEAIPYLWFPAFAEEQPLGVRMAAHQALNKLVGTSRTERLSSVEASVELRRLSRLLYENSALLPRDEAGTVTIWGWDPEQQTVVAKTYSPQIASILLSTRFASQSLAMSPDQPEPQQQYLASLLGLEVLQQGWDKAREPLPGTAMYLAVTAGETTVANVLADALSADQRATAVAALEVLGQIGTREQLLGQKGLKSPVLAALNSPDTRVQFAAAVAILRMEPRVAFPNASRVVSILSRALTDPGQATAIIIDADSARASEAGSYLAELGYEPVTATTGRDGFERAATTAGVEIVVVHANCIRWDLTQTLSNLRADSRTAAIPIVVYGAEDVRNSVARLVARNKPAMFIAESSTSSDFGRQFAPLTREAKSPPISPQERSQQKIASAYWLSLIATNRNSQIFDVATAEKEIAIVAEDPDVGGNALAALSSIGTGSAQRRLAEVASNPQLDPPLRQAAGLQLGFHIQRFGLLLTKDEVGAVHEAWVSADNPTIKAALAGVMGTLRPNQALVGERLRQFPLPTIKTPN
jgi:CheY-like chemotaxis protein